MIKARGTRKQIIQSWKAAYEKVYPDEPIEVKFFENLFDSIYDHSGDFSEDESFVILNARFDDEKDKLITSDTEYFIGIASSTWFACTLIAARMTNPLIGAGMNFAERMTEIPYIDAKLFKHLKNAEGEGCIMLEAFESRRDGIDKNVLKKYKGECAHMNLGCRYLEKGTGHCQCEPDGVEDIIDDLERWNLLKRKRKKYFYNDIL